MDRCSSFKNMKISDRTGDAKLVLGATFICTSLLLWYFLWPLCQLCSAAFGVRDRTQEWIQLTRSASGSLGILMFLMAIMLITGGILLLFGVLEKIRMRMNRRGCSDASGAA